MDLEALLFVCFAKHMKKAYLESYYREISFILGVETVFFILHTQICSRKV